MSCRSIEELEHYARGEVGTATRAELDAHLPTCPQCAEHLADVQRGLELARRVHRAASVMAQPGEAEAPASASDAARVPEAAGHASARNAAGSMAGSSPALGGQLPEDAFPGYTIVRELSHGGQGVVYQAIQQSTRRKVAVKVLREGHFADPRERARFEREVQILGQLKHPNIVTIYDSGGVGGNAYFVMDYVSGEPLDEFAAKFRAGRERDDDSRPAEKESQSREPAARGGRPRVPGRRTARAAGIEAILRLFANVCEAVHAAHLRGIIHRDLKPSNIRVDADGEPHVLDFGLAKVAGASELAQSPAMTMTGQFLGSLPWSSPEQAEGQPGKIDIRTDVYSLGVILYQLLTGRFPYDVTGNMRDVLDRIMHAEPLRPRLAVGSSAGASERRASFVPSWLRRSEASPIDDEVETIVLKCLAKERERRYQSAGDLARDIHRYLAREPIEAKRDSGFYVLRKALRRHRTAVSVGAMLFVTLAAALGISLAARHRAAQERDRALAAERRKQLVLAFLTDVFGAANPLSARPTSGARDPPRSGPQYAGRAGHLATVTDLLHEAVSRLDQSQLDPLVEAELRHVLGRTLAESGQFESGIPQLRRAVELRAAHAGPYAPESLESLERLVYAVFQTGRKSEALALARPALEQVRAERGAADLWTAALARHVARALEAGNRMNEAVELLRELADAAAAQRGAPDEQVVELRLELARVLSDCGRPIEALAINRQVREALAGRPEARLLHIRATEGVADALYDLGRYREAAESSREAVRAYAAEYGDDHPWTAYQMVYLARSLGEADELEEARAVAERALECQRRFGGDDHPDTYRAERCLARILARLSTDLERAEALARHAAAGYARVREPGHFDILYAQDVLALVLQQRGRLDEAEAIYRQNLERGRLTPEVLLRARLLRALGGCLAQRGKLQEAEEELLAAWQCAEETVGVGSDLARQIAEDLVRLYQTRHAAEPDTGHEHKAAEWQAKLQAWHAAARPGDATDGAPRR